MLVACTAGCGGPCQATGVLNPAASLPQSPAPSGPLMPATPTPGTVVIGQSGGPTAVINQTLIGVVKACLAKPETFTKVLGAIHGIKGILDNKFCDFWKEDLANLEVVAGTPSAALKSVRH